MCQYKINFIQLISSKFSTPFQLCLHKYVGKPNIFFFQVNVKWPEFTGFFSLAFLRENEIKVKYKYLNVYKTLPSFQILSILLGVVIQWASAFLEFRKNVSGIQIFPTMLLFNLSTFIVLLNFRRLSYHVWAKNISIVYSCCVNQKYWWKHSTQHST